MNEKRIRATVAISGLTLMVLALAEMITWNNPQLSDPASRVRDIFVADSTTSSVSIFLTALTVIPILAFAASLRVLAQRTSGIDSVWALLASGAASVFAAAQITFAALSGALVAGAPDATDHEIRLLLGPLTFLDAARFMPFAVMTAAAALATREAGVVPPLGRLGGRRLRSTELRIRTFSARLERAPWQHRQRWTARLLALHRVDASDGLVTAAPKQPPSIVTSSDS
jgi:hypothetical protein